MIDTKANNSELVMAGNFVVSCLVASIVGVAIARPMMALGRHGDELNTGMPDSGGTGGLVVLALLFISFLGLIGTFGYGVLSIAAWMRARAGLPVISIALAWINLLVLAIATYLAFSSGWTLSQCAAFAALWTAALAICIVLKASRAPAATQ